MALWKKSDEKARPSVDSTRQAAEPKVAETEAANGAVAELSSDQLRQMAGAAKAATATFGEIVSVLMRSPHYKHYSLADLEWLVAPALVAGQFSVATAQSKVQPRGARRCCAVGQRL